MSSKRTPSITSFEPLRPCCFQTDAGFLYTKLDTPLTGIAGASLWCPAGEFTRHLPHHGARVLVARPRRPALRRRGTPARARMDPAAQVTLSTPSLVIGALPPGLAQAAKRFVDRNVDILLAHWAGDVDSWSLMQGVLLV